MAHLKRCPLPQGYRGAIIEAAAWKDTQRQATRGTDVEAVKILAGKIAR